MQKSNLIVAVLGVAFMQFEFLSPAFAEEKAPIDTAKIEAATGLKGTFNKGENVFKVSKPRTDVKIRVEDWQMPPFMGLTSWAAFTPGHDGQTMMMGDTVLFEDEVNPAMSAALDNGLDVTALHNHFFFDEPKVYFMHIGGMGDAATLAAGVKKVYDKIAEIRAAQPTPQKSVHGWKDRLAQLDLARNHLKRSSARRASQKTACSKLSLVAQPPCTASRLVRKWASIPGPRSQAPTIEAVVDGDFAMNESELQTVLKAMRKEGINIVAIHQHMINEEPRILFLHYWGLGKAVSLAQSLETVLKAQAAAAR